MIQPRSIVKITDNSGGTTGRIFKVLGGSKRRYAELGDEVVLSVQTAQPRKAVKKRYSSRRCRSPKESVPPKETVLIFDLTRTRWFLVEREKEGAESESCLWPNSA